LLCLILSHSAIAHDYEHPAIYDIDQNWLFYRGDIQEISKIGDSLLIHWESLKYQEEVLLPDNLEKGEIIWLAVALPKIQIDDPVLLFEEMLPDYQIYYKKELIFSIGSIEEDIKQNFRGDERRLLSIKNLEPVEHVYFRIKVNEDPLLRKIAKVHIGKHADFFSSFFETDLKFVILGFFFLFSAIIPFITFIKYSRSRENGALSLLTFSFGILTLSESVFFDLWLNSGELFLYIVEPFSFLAAASLCLYFETIFGSGYKSNLRILRLINLILVVVVLPALILIQPPVIYWLAIKLAFFALFILIMLSTFLFGFVLAIKGNREARVIMIGYSALSLFGILDILGGVFSLFPWSPGWYPWGILLLVLVMQYNTQYSLKKFTSDLENSQNELIVSRFESLKNQINPHFLFNNLNTLSSLIFIDREQAATFVRDLSKVYRFILETRDKELIDLKDELAILEAYIFLVQTRFKESLQINLENIGEHKNKEIPPLCLQMLIENAIKHNVTSKTKPLRIDIFFENADYIVVENNLQPKSSKEYSSKIGLKNIASRYSYLTKQAVIIEESKEKFIVKIPLL